MRKSNVQSTSKTPRLPVGTFALACTLALIWFVMVLATSSRMYFLLTYEVGKMVEPFWEPFAATNIVVLFSFVVVGTWLLFLWLNYQIGCNSQGRATLYFGTSLLPFVFWLLRVTGNVTWSAHFWEAIWIAVWTGFSFGELARHRLNTVRSNGVPRTIEMQVSKVGWKPYLALALMTVLVCCWWFGQSIAYHQNFLLGYNDFGHFLQRIVNTAEGRGFLLESPVLPAFWDHFNPGLLLMVPLWKVYPSVKLVFALQAGSLAVCSLLVCAISRRLGHDPTSAALFGVAWLVQPSVGQMNLAYTYGWHPVTFTIPLMFAAILCLLRKQKFGALGCIALAMAMEESVFVIVALVAAVCGVMPLVDKKLNQNANAKKIATRSEGLAAALPPAIWFLVAVTSTVGFLLVYRFSGLAEFQTARFVALGNSPLEVLLSPLIRPSAFWGQLLRLENFMYIMLLLLPCCLPALLRGWRYLLPTLLPLGVLSVWDHVPAHCIAFQYPSTLLPMFWLAGLTGAMVAGATEGSVGSKLPSAFPCAMTAVATGVMLSLFLGQLPFSSVTLRDVEAMTYGVKSELQRKSDAEDGQWLLQQVAKLRESGDECLATARIAAHLVGNRDIETVAQYLERREQLAALPDRNGTPIKHYRWIILDRYESVKSSGQQTAAVESEARESGFELTEDRFGVVIFKRTEP